MSAPTPSAPTPQDAGIQKVGNLELFLDLVFVYTISQITGTLGHPHGPETYLHAVLMFLSLMWVYDGFTWLSSNTDLSGDAEGWLVFVAMAGFFMMAVAIPTVWEGSGGPLFGAGLILTTLIHALMFARTHTSSAQAIWRVAPTNLLSAGMVLLCAYLPHEWRAGVWALALAVFIFPIVLRQVDAQFSLSPRHFAERHGLLIIIALGEMVMGVGVGLKGSKLDIVHLGYALTGLMLSAWLWWSYFGPDNERAEHALMSTAPEHRARMALQGFGFGHFGMLAGIVLTAAGLEVAVHDPLAHAHGPTALNLSAGLSLYFLSDVYFRRVMGIGPGRLRSALALALLPTTWLGLHVSAFAQLGACVALILAVLTYEDYVLNGE